MTTFRYIVGGGMVVATRPIYQGIGVRRYLSFLGLLAVVLVPAPWVLVRYGYVIRERSQFAASSGSELSLIHI